MKDINIGSVILDNRKLKGITQDELANYIGVSKASVSKWETSQSYPDITFLPQLASYFNISIDELMNYQPQMTKEDIRNLFLRLSNDFSQKPFDDVIINCREVIKSLDEPNSLLVSSEILLARAYEMMGNVDKASEILQIEIYQYLFTLLQLFQSYLSSAINDGKQFDEISKRFLAIADIFHVEKLKPDALLTFYLILAQGNIVNGNSAKALESLENYARIATGDIYPLKLEGDDFFTLIDQWFENFPIGANLPRDERVIKQSMYDAVAHNPIFSSFENDSQFKNFIIKLKNNL